MAFEGANYRVNACSQYRKYDRIKLEIRRGILKLVLQTIEY